jgi:hypothetical protein
MVKKSVYDTLNGYDESLVYEDLIFDCASEFNDFDFIDEILIQKKEQSKIH